MNIISERKWFFIACIAALAVTVYSLSYIVFSPGCILLSMEGDAPKNYFTFLYHSLYGNGAWFSGMNYPFGEHIVFTDAQPAFSMALGFINRYVYVNPLVVFHLLIAAGYFSGIIYLYKILLRFHVEHLWAIIFASLIIVMSPQQFKLWGHFSLAYMCVLPMVFYYNLAWLQTQNIKYTRVLFAAVLLFTFVHLYYALMICFWIGLYSFGYFVFYKGAILSKLKHLYPLWLTVIVPVALLKIFMLLTDTVTDRPGYPYGARHNRTFNNDLYTSYLSPFWRWANKFMEIGTLSGGDEGYTYIGLVPICILLTAFVLCLFKIIRERKVKIQAYNIEQNFSIWVLVAAGMLIFASSIIFVKCFVCLDYASFIRQFRAVGRFSWAYYYIATTLSVVILYRWHAHLVRNKKTIIAFAISGMLSISWFIEARPFALMTRSISERGVEAYRNFYTINESEWHTFLQEYGYNKQSFQAILALPYFHIGTEKLGMIPRSGHLLTQAFSTSLQLQLPLMNVMMSRSSWSKAFAQVKISGGPLTEKYFLYTDNKKPLLVFHDPVVKLTPDEEHLLIHARKLGHLHKCDIYALYPDTLHLAEEQYKESLRAIFKRMDAKDTCLNFTGTWYAEHFDDGFSENILYGAGAEKAIVGNTAIIFNGLITPLYDSQQYEFSAWVLVSNKDHKIGRFRVIGYDANDSTVLSMPFLVQESVDNHGLWLRASGYFRIPSNCARIQVELINIINPSYLALDELMIRPADAVIISKMPDGTGMVNNHLFK